MQRTSLALLSLLLVSGAGPVWADNTDLYAVFQTPDERKPGYLAFYHQMPFNLSVGRIAGNYNSNIDCGHNGAPNCSGKWGLTPRHHGFRDPAEGNFLVALQNPGAATTRLFLHSCPDVSFMFPDFGTCPGYPSGDERWGTGQTSTRLILTPPDINGQQYLLWYDYAACAIVRRWNVTVIGLQGWQGIGNNVGAVSDDGRYVVLSTHVSVPGDRFAFAVVDTSYCPTAPECGPARFSQTIFADFPCDLISGCADGYVTISPKHNYVVASFAGGQKRVWSFVDTPPMTITPMDYATSACVDTCTIGVGGCPQTSAYGNSHDGYIYAVDRADLSVNFFDSNNEVIVGAEACGKYSEGSNPPLVATEFQDTITAGPVAQVSLGTGGVSYVVPRRQTDTSGAFAVPARSVSGRTNSRAGWVYITWDNEFTGNGYGKTETRRYSDELTTNRLIGPAPNNTYAIQRWGKHHSDFAGCPLCEPQAVPNPGGLTLYFASNWQYKCGAKNCGGNFQNAQEYLVTLVTEPCP